jgi:alpha-L-fucosidase 2
LLVSLLVTAKTPAELQAPAPAEPLSLWYTQPASRWVEALPIGNGRLAGMVFGGIVNERIQLNEDTLWAGGPYDPANPEALAALPTARRLIVEGKYQEAEALIGEKMMGRPLRQMPFQPLGDLLLTFSEFPQVEAYRRDLNLDTAIARVTYVAQGVTYTRETFSSAIDQVIVFRISASQPARVSLTVAMSSPQPGASSSVENATTLLLRGTNSEAQGIKGALTFAARARVVAQGGTVQPATDSIAVHNADAVTILLAAATSFRSYSDVSGDPGAITQSQIEAATRKPFPLLRKVHVTDYQRFFRRVSLNLGSSPAASQPTDERIRNFASVSDPQLAALYFQFGRYLLISSSRPGTQPPTLQGDWNDQMKPPWESKYTININTEMNYWPAETTNLSELVEPLVAMVLDLSRTGVRTAQVQYGARGWVAHHNTDLWRATAPIDGPAYGMWPTGGAWLCQHLWEHYEFTQDKGFLERVYPALKGAAEFFLDTLVEEPSHKWLVTSPSLSPENRHPFGTSIVAGPSMDMQILSDLFMNTMEAAEILGRDAELRQQLAAARPRLAPSQIGSAGQLQEWLEDWDMKAPDLHHRHVSHLYALFPSDQITARGTPQLADAARRSLEIRGDEATGWGLGWRLNLWARLLDGEHAYRILTLLLTPDRTYPNMFDAHPPFQIDGNFGGTSGIAEMLLQSQSGVIELLPALPKAWPTGSVRGLRARGGFEVDIAWRGGQLTSATVRAMTNNDRVRLRYGATTREVRIFKGQTYQW